MFLLVVSLLLSVLVMYTSFYLKYQFIISILFLLLAPTLYRLQFTIGCEKNAIQINIKKRLFDQIAWSSKAVIFDLGIIVGSVFIFMLCVQFSFLKFDFESSKILILLFVYKSSKILIFLLPVVHIFLQRKKAYFLTNVFFSGAMVIFWTTITFTRALSDIESVQTVLLQEPFLWGGATLVWGILGECLLRYLKSRKVEN